MKKILLTMALCATTLLVANAKKTPPPQAIDACKGKKESSSCSVTTPQGKTLEGVCRNTPDKKYFACIPKNHKPTRR